MQYNKNDPNTIQEMFNSIAHSYDKTNSILSFQMHKRWNQALIQQVIFKKNPDKILDLCCGTGAISLEYLKQIKSHASSRPPSKVCLLDFSSEMLAYARNRAEIEGLSQYDITYLQADAQAIPLPDNYIDCVTIAYGIRNVKQPQQCFNDAYRVLKADGIFGILELTQPANPILRLGHSLYLRTLLPVIGKIATSNKQAYSYLCNSIHTFIPPESLKALMRTAGFKDLQQISLMGGIATILIGRK